MRRLIPPLLAFALAVPAGAYAQDGEAEAVASCEDTAEMDRFRLYRQMSLDLRGRVPSMAEMQALAEAGDAPLDDAAVAAMADEMIEDEEFWNFFRRHHLDMLWPNLDQIELVNAAIALLLPAFLYDNDGTDGERLFNLYTGLYGRGGLVPCLDEPAEFDDEGYPVMTDYGDGTMREGWVMVEPYWAPGTQIKVCALEARNMAVANNGQGCDTAQGMLTGTCGCGAHLERCLSIDSGRILNESLQQQLLGALEAPVRDGGSYFSALQGNQEQVNGPIVHYYRHQVMYAVDPVILRSPVDLETLPDIPFDAVDEWHEVERVGPHSGILTSLVYLLRFQTARARANRFYNAFFCSAFVAPADGLPSPNDDCSQNPNLRERCGCNACHASLEPLAAYWGRFANAGSMYLDPEEFPTYVGRCANCADDPERPCDQICDRFYVTEVAEGDENHATYAGVLRSYEFLPAEEVERVEQGPQGLVDLALSNNTLGQCATVQLFRRFYNRDPLPEEQGGLVRDYSNAFVDGGYDYKQLVKAMVTDPAYRRLDR
jgi:hypothetical protein